MYDIKRFYDYEKDFIESTGKHNIFPLSNQGVKLYTDKDSHFVHKYITGRKLDLYPSYNNQYQHQGNFEEKSVNNFYYQQNIKSNEASNNNRYNNNGYNDFSTKIVKDVLHSQGNISSNNRYDFIDQTNINKKDRVKSQYIPNTRLYKSPNSRLNSENNNHSRSKSKSPSPKKENLLLYNHLPKIGDSLKNMENGIKKNGTSPINQVNKKIFLSVFGSGSLNKQSINKNTEQVEKELLEKQHKYEKILENQLKNTFCEENNLAKIQNFPKQKKSLLSNIQTNRSFMGLKFNPFNYQFIDFKNKKK